MKKEAVQFLVIALIAGLTYFVLASHSTQPEEVELQPSDYYILGVQSGIDIGIQVGMELCEQIMQEQEFSLPPLSEMPDV